MKHRNLDLDDTDRQIIRHLQTDGRLSYAQLGPMVGLSQAAVRQRVNRMSQSGVLQIVAVADPGRLGMNTQALIGIETNGDVRVIADELARIEDLKYVVICAGRYDVICEAMCADNDALISLTNDRIRPIDGVERIEVLSYLKVAKESYSWGA